MSQAAFKFSYPMPGAESELKKVIDAFGQLQDHRYMADYDVERIWSRTAVKNALALAEEAFIAWRNIRKEQIAQDHLMTMFGARRG